MDRGFIMSINHTTELTAAQTLIESLTLDIDNMKRDLDLERKAKAVDIKMYGDWLEGMIEMEVTHPMGPDNTHVLKGCLEYFNKKVVK